MSLYVGHSALYSMLLQGFSEFYVAFFIGFISLGAVQDFMIRL